MSPQTLHRRFFSLRRSFSEAEQSFFVNIDFINHVVLIAVVEESGEAAIVGGARYIVGKPGQAEAAFAVVDKFQGKGIGSALLRHLVAIARDARLRELTAQVLLDNAPMLSVFERSGLKIDRKHEFGVLHLTLKL